MKLPIDDQAIKCFQELGNHRHLSEMDGEDLLAEVRGLEEFLCVVYSSCGLTSIPALRWELFRSKNLEGEMLPPTQGPFFLTS